MKRLILIMVMSVFALAVLACQERFDSPQTVTWDAPVDNFVDTYEVAVQRNGTGEIIILLDQDTESAIIDLALYGLYGRYVILVRSVAVTEPDLIDVSDWIRSDVDTDVITIDGAPQTFMIQFAKPAGKPSSIRRTQ